MEKVSRFDRIIGRGVHRLFRGGAFRFRGVQPAKGVHIERFNAERISDDLICIAAAQHETTSD